MAARLLGLRIRIPPGAWIFVLCCTVKTKKQVRKKYKGGRREGLKKKIPVEENFFVPVRPPSPLCNGYRVFSGGKAALEGDAGHHPLPAPRERTGNIPPPSHCLRRHVVGLSLPYPLFITFIIYMITRIAQEVTKLDLQLS